MDLPEYREVIARIESYDETAWRANKGAAVEEIAGIDREMRKTGRRHYAVRYNRFMGVRSDWEDDHISA
jgi:hypothetical protein